MLKLNPLTGMLEEEKPFNMIEDAGVVQPSPSQRGATSSWGEPESSNQEALKSKPRKPAPIKQDLASKILESPNTSPELKAAIAKQFDFGEYSDENRSKLQDELSQPDYGGALQQGLAGVASVFLGKDPAAAQQAIAGQRERAKQSKLDSFDQGRGDKIQKYHLDKNVRDDAVSQEKLARETDPNSQESKLAQDLAKSMGMSDTSRLTAKQFQDFSPVMSKKYEIEQKKLDRQEARDERRFQQGIKMDEKHLVRDEKKKAALNEVEDRRRNIEDNLKLLEEQIKEDGTYEVFGSHNADLDRRVDMIATDMAKLADPSSVARPSEVEMFKKGLVHSNMASMTNDTALNLLKNFRKEVNDRAANAYKIRGIEDPGSQQRPTASEVERKTADGKIAIFDSSTKKFLRYK